MSFLDEYHCKVNKLSYEEEVEEEVEEGTIEILNNSLKELTETTQIGTQVLNSVVEQGYTIDNVSLSISRIYSRLKVANRMISRVQGVLSSLVVKPFQQKVGLNYSSILGPKIISSRKFSSGKEIRIDFDPEEDNLNELIRTSKGVVSSLWDFVPVVNLFDKRTVGEAKEVTEEGNQMKINELLQLTSDELLILKELSYNLGSSLDSQNRKLDLIDSEAERVHDKFKKTNRRIEEEVNKW